MIRKLSCAIFGFFLCTMVHPAGNKQEKATQKLPDLTDALVLIGTENGLYKVENHKEIPLWTNGSVQKILKADVWYLLTSQGIFKSTDLITFIDCNTGLPENIIKVYENGAKSFQNQVQLLKDFEIHPDNPDILVTATKDAVFLSKDGGGTWKNLGANSRLAGIKAVAVATLPNQTNGNEELVVFISHAIYSLGFCKPDAPKIEWTDIQNGFELLETAKTVDEVSDILAVSQATEKGIKSTTIYIAQTFRPRIYKLDWKNLSGVLLWKGENPAETIDGLFLKDTDLFFSTQGKLANFNVETLHVSVPSFDFLQTLEKNNITTFPHCLAYMLKDQTYFFSELWLLNPKQTLSAYAKRAANRKGLYLPVNRIVTDAGLNRFIDIMNKNKLDTAVVDMKDDQGLLRYNSLNPLVQKKGFFSKFSLHLETFIQKMKAENKYLVARIVVFKDKHLYTYDKGKYAVWDTKKQAAWQGINRYVDEIVDEKPTGKKLAEMFDEYWVDPYSEEVWEYNIAIAKELIERGFDEIQFDYIRFPTDGLNLGEANFRWRESSMDKESALISFLSYARQNIDAPIGIDIYGANGFYRSGTRTGQDVELLARFVDVISPMFYPSHFEQTFYAQEPAEERPYRVYYYGSFRNTVIGRNKIIVRPWTQAFYLNVSYDKKYYNEDYVQKQIYGIRDSINNGYLHWNNSGRYDDIRPDLDFDAMYPWNSFEANGNFRKPIFGGN